MLVTYLLDVRDRPPNMFERNKSHLHLPYSPFSLSLSLQLSVLPNDTIVSINSNTHSDTFFLLFYVNPLFFHIKLDREKKNRKTKEILPLFFLCMRVCDERMI